MTGIYDGASTAHWYQTKYPGNQMNTNTVVWHSTEGTSLPTYSGGSEAPTLTAVPDFAKKRLVWYQHFSFDVSARALENHAGGVETNTLNVAQVEITGTCDPATHAKWTKAGIQHLYMPELPDWVIRDLGAFAKWTAGQGVPLNSGVTFKAYPASYGSTAGVRMSGSAWTDFSGHCGHQHVPENVHGDPGQFPMAAILAAAKGPVAPTIPPVTAAPEDDMPDLLAETNPNPVAIKADTWTLIAMASDSAILQGPCKYTVTAYATVTGAPGTDVTGRFQDYTVATKKPSMDLPMHAGVIGSDGRLDVALTRPGALDAGEQLRFEVLADTAVTVTFRVVRGLVWRP